ncbi:hypothetical protein [Mariniradius saccharolyticus]|uniref:hypothetical protein n=1 Tax=Mariniradius saccharolyticus TaxID=1245591 RepID=UPI0002A6A06E|nr:hypothetical protein [Mariniradius saccharolyticus]
MKYFPAFWVITLFLFASCSDDSGNPNTENDIPFVTDHFAVDAAGNTYLAGFDQVSSNNQDPFIHKKNSRGETLWRLRYEETPVDGRAVLVAWNEGRLYAVMTVDGGSVTTNSITRHQVVPGAFEGVFQSGYGVGGGPRVSLVMEIDTETGKIKKGTFITARLTDGNTNALLVPQIGFSNGRIVLRAVAAAWPPGAGTSYVRFPNISDADRIEDAFWLRYEMELDFSRISKADLLQSTF